MIKSADSRSPSQQFEEAAKDPPNWEHLNLEWGKTPYWAGRRDGLKKQITIATGFDLAPDEKASLEAWVKTHG
jgi:hypothetical protein